MPRVHQRFLRTTFYVWRSQPRKHAMPNWAERCAASLQHKGSDLSPTQDLRCACSQRRARSRQDRCRSVFSIGVAAHAMDILEMTEVPGQTIQGVGIHPVPHYGFLTVVF
jgi:hypothetical protein